MNSLAITLREEVVLLGRSEEQNTVRCPYGDELPENWLAHELNRRFHSIPESISATVADGLAERSRRHVQDGEATAAAAERGAELTGRLLPFGGFQIPIKRPVARQKNHQQCESGEFKPGNRQATRLMVAITHKGGKSLPETFPRTFRKPDEDCGNGRLNLRCWGMIADTNRSTGAAVGRRIRIEIHWPPPG